jgi:hypothetical protein
MLVAMKKQSAASEDRTDDRPILCGRTGVRLSQISKVVLVAWFRQIRRTRRRSESIRAYGAMWSTGWRESSRNRTHAGPRTAVATQVAKAVTTLLFLYLHRLGAEGRDRRSHPHFVPVERFSATRLLAKATKRDQVVDDLNLLSKSLSPAIDSASGPIKASAISGRSTGAYSGIGGGG